MVGSCLVVELSMNHSVTWDQGYARIWTQGLISEISTWIGAVSLVTVCSHQIALIT